MPVAYDVFACFLGVLCVVGVIRASLALLLGRRRRALYWLCQTLVLIWGLFTFVWLIILHWIHDSYAYFVLTTIVPVYCQKPLAEMDKSITRTEEMDD